MFLSELREFPSVPCLARKKNLMTARVSMLLKSRASLTCYRACFFPGRAKDLSATQYNPCSAYVKETDDDGFLGNMATLEVINKLSYFNGFQVCNPYSES